MKIKPYLNLRLIFFFLILAACSTARINISVLQPAEISIPLSIQKVSLFPGAGIPDPPGTFDSINCVKLKPDYDYNRIKRGYMEGIYEIIQQSPRFKRVLLTDTCYENLISEGVVSWGELREICIHDSTDAVLLLKKTVTYDILDYFSEDEYCGLRYNLVSHTKWCFYDPFSMVASDDFIFTDFNNYEQGVTCGLHPPVSNIAGILYDACVLTGNRIGEQICPSWKDDVQRIIFKGPGKSLIQAYFLASHSQWNQAAVIWNDLSNSPNRNEACRASYNLAITWERDDDLEQAKEWALYADSLRSSKRIEGYLKILDQRIRLKAELDNQMTGK
jgi:hypothetical protein